MSVSVASFLSRVDALQKSGSATEHSYRSALEALFSDIGDGIEVINEPKRIACGAPDLIFNKSGVTIGHAEAKDIGVDLRAMKGTNKDQRDRYLKGLPNLVYTNCLDFDFYREGELIASVTIADLLLGIQPRPENFERLENLIGAFLAERPQTITSTKKLAAMMAGKALVIKDVFTKALKSDPEFQTELSGQFSAFREHLIHDITAEDFADIYAETVAYGMFAARLHDETKSFSRHEALELLPKSNPFLRKLFTFIAGPDLDDNLKWIIDELAFVFQATDLRALMEDFGRLTGRNDPFVHFYEDFLSAYNPAKRKARGVWYTPEPVVNFIVRAVDEVLQTEFGLPMGLADTSKVRIDWDTGQTDKKGRALTNKRDVHRVQILDPATGTGTFLTEVIKLIAPRIKRVAEGMWSSYIEKDLIPRLHGFELLMASYAMCHLKLDMVLTEMGYKPTGHPPRLSVYLTNSLEEGEPANQTLPFAQWLSNEVKAANTIKRDMPIMCVIGNPPYSGESVNKGDWIMGLMEAYKKEPGGKEKLKERNPKWINDDYVKFIRFAEHMIEKNGEGVLGFITNHGYLDNPTFRGMRWHLLKTFDKIYVLDLHGNSLKKEVAPDGSADKNVFDIMPGVAIIVAVKKSATPAKAKDVELAQVFHADLWGDRQGKYEALWAMSPKVANWTTLPNTTPQFPFVQRDFALEEVYRQGFGIQELMPVNSVGIVTARDGLTIDMNKDALWARVQDMAAGEPEQLRQKYKLGKDVRDWTVAGAQRDLRDGLDLGKVQPIAYRPFDRCWTYYTGKSRGFMCYPRGEVMRNYIGRENIGLLAPSGVKDSRFRHVFVTDSISEVIYLSGTTASNAKNFPLYLYPSEQDLDQTRRVNFDPKLYKKLRDLARDDVHGEPDEIAVFDYIYGVLHCPGYREAYAEFLKIDFPRIPWPNSPASFWEISHKGGQLRRLHLMEPEAIGETPFPFKGQGDNLVDKPTRDDEGRVWINTDQYFENISQTAWEFYIGGYQPAQKWLKDRKGRTLSFDDVVHYQRIIKILDRTDGVMKSIEMDL